MKFRIPHLPLAVLLTGLSVCLLPLTADEPASARPKNLAAALQPFVDRHELAGAVLLVADRERVLERKAVGFADLTTRKRMTVDALFWIASQSKPITAAALLMLVDEGKLKLDDPVEKYLPAFHDEWVMLEKATDHLLLGRPKRPVTVRDLLRHTSGLPFRSALEEPTLDLLPLRVAAGSYAMTPLQFEPGSRYSYSNAGFNTAGRIIEILGGRPYEQFLQQRLFAIHDLIATEQRVCVRWSAEGTHAGDLVGLPATGKRLRITGQTIYDIVGEHVASHWQVVDRLGFMQQLRAGSA